MKKVFIILSAVVVLTTGGFLIWKYTRPVGSCAKENCDYSDKMSVICEFSCAARDVDEGKIVAQSVAKSGDYTRCPVSGVVFQVTEGSSTIKYGDKKAFTCCG